MAHNRSPEWFKGLKTYPSNDLWTETSDVSSQISSRSSSARSRGAGFTSTRTSDYDTRPNSRVSNVNDDLLTIGSQSRETSAKYGRRSSISSSSSNTSQSQSKPNTGLNFEELQQSLSNLNIFNRLQRENVDPYSSKSSLEKVTTRSLTYDNVLPIPVAECFVIPELPEGQQLILNIRSTWGDNYYVGLNGIEMFSSDGQLIKIKSIWADPADINVLPEYTNDPRIVTNLINGIYRTTDDLNLWLAPFTKENDHLICINFERRVRLAMMRIWNYNKSRIHSFRGVRNVEISLDGQLIFRGEITKACGGLTGPLMDAFGDMILFTLDEEILELISHNDETFSIKSDDRFIEESEREIHRPLTSNSDVLYDVGRPFTTANPVLYEKKVNDELMISKSEQLTTKGQMIEFFLLQNWSGDCNVIGLTSIEILGKDGNALPIPLENVKTSPINYEDSVKLFDGNNVTTSIKYMFLYKQHPNSDQKSENSMSPSVVIPFDQIQHFSGIRVWNYNPSLEDSYYGVKLMSVRVNGQLISPQNGFLIRRAPGNRHYDFAQEIPFFLSTNSGKITSQYVRKMEVETLSPPSGPLSRMSVFEEYEPTMMPRGFVFQFQLYNAWHDSYYVGLNGIELFDSDGFAILLSGSDIAAFPDSVNVLDEINNDVRTPDRLIDGVNDTRDARHMWLAPILPNIVNRVYIIFDYPVTVSMIKLWNYANKPNRGVKDFALFVDDLLVYHGSLKKANSIDGNPITHSTILFTKDDDIYKQERHFALRNSSNNDCNFAYDSEKFGKDETDQSLRPFTSLLPPIFSVLE